MAISGNPKMMAQDVAKGYLNITSPSLKKYTPADLKVLLNNLAIVQREIRSEVVPQEDPMAMKAKNMRLQRINTAISVINSYAKQRRIKI